MGATLGNAEGLSVGEALGTGVGFIVGCMEGVQVGEALGLNEGATEGCQLGRGVNVVGVLEG